jgi:hypothetical protein
MFAYPGEEEEEEERERERERERKKYLLCRVSYKELTPIITGPVTDVSSF